MSQYAASNVYTPEYYAALVEIQRERNAKVDKALEVMMADFISGPTFWDDYIAALDEDFK